MSSENAKAPFLAELLKVELEGECYHGLFEKFFTQGGTLDLLIDGLNQQILKELKDKISAFPSLESSSQEKQYLNIRKSLFEMKKWFELHIEFYKKVYRIDLLDSQTLEKVQSVLTAFDEMLEKTLDFLPHVSTLRTRRLQTDFKSSIEKIRTQLQVNMFGGFQIKKRVKLIHFQLAALVYQKVLDKLELIKAFILANRAKWDEAILDKARSIYIPPPAEFPYPLIYTPEGRIYIVQEVLEHFVGLGGGKYVSRSFEMQSGAISALIRPRTKDRYIEDPELLKVFETQNYEKAWREAAFLYRLKGKEGIIQIQELFIFPIADKLEFFEIMELLEGQDLSSILYQRSRPEKYYFSLSREDELQIAHDILKGVKALSDEGIIHRDLKAANVLVELSSDQKQAKAKIIDFNFACFNNESFAKTLVSYNILCCAPEYARALFASNFDDSQIVADATSEKLDIWGAGCLLYRLFFNTELPWKIEEQPIVSQKADMELSENTRKQKEIEEEKQVRAQVFAILLSLEENWISADYHSNPFYPLIKAMLTIDPEQRISAAEALALFEELLRKHGFQTN
jgi:serine/threonine protein kinase